MKHHTKTKGDIGLAAVIFDLTSNGYQVALPISEHQSWDCIAISDIGVMLRLSVRYRGMKNGVVGDKYRSQWVDKNGIHHKFSDRKEFDATAIYCPDTNECYYIKNEEVKGSCISLRIDDPKNFIKSIKYAKDYIDPDRIFPQVAR